jgi:hypothetical protein
MSRTLNKELEMITDQQRLVNYLQAAIDAMLQVIDLEQKITHNAHPNWTYRLILNDMRFKLDGETALLRRQEVLGR